MSDLTNVVPGDRLTPEAEPEGPLEPRMILRVARLTRTQAVLGGREIRVRLRDGVEPGSGSSWHAPRTWRIAERADLEDAKRRGCLRGLRSPNRKWSVLTTAELWRVWAIVHDAELRAEANEVVK